MAETFGTRLQRLREREKLTLDGLGKLIGSSKSYVWELENKPNIRPSAELVYKLSKALNTTVGVLMGEPELDEMPKRDQVFFRNYQSLSEETKDTLEKIMRALEDDSKKEKGS